MENKWKEVANLFGLELEEEFEIQGKEGTFEFGDFGLCKLVDGYWHNSPTILTDLITENYRVIKKPWKPKVGERYYYWSAIDTALETIWSGLITDYYRWKTGNYFKTKEEAETKGKELIEQIEKEYEES